MYIFQIVPERLFDLDYKLIYFSCISTKRSLVTGTLTFKKPVVKYAATSYVYTDFDVLLLY